MSLQFKAIVFNLLIAEYFVTYNKGGANFFRPHVIMWSFEINEKRKLDIWASQTYCNISNTVQNLYNYSLWDPKFLRIDSINLIYKSIHLHPPWNHPRRRDRESVRLRQSPDHPSVARPDPDSPCPHGRSRSGEVG